MSRPFYWIFFLVTSVKSEIRNPPQQKSRPKTTNCVTKGAMQRIRSWIGLVLFSMQSWNVTSFAGSASPKLFLGFDLGTSGARISVIDTSGSSTKEVYSEAVAWGDAFGIYDDPNAWMQATIKLCQRAGSSLGGLEAVQALCVSGTSASCLMVNRETFQVTRSPRMYNYDVVTAATKRETTSGERAVELLEKHAPPKHTARARTGSLAKLLSWSLESRLDEEEVLCHQSDYVSTKLMGRPSEPIRSDWHNCLKLGYDVRQKCWPIWMESCLHEAGIEGGLEDSKFVIPKDIFSPGARMGVVNQAMARKMGLQEGTVIVGGTTDSNAAFFAAAGISPAFGTAVTSLGSTLAIKQLSETYVEDADRGVYSHRFPNFKQPDTESWLVGGASNVGCAVLRQLEFSSEELIELSAKIDPLQDSDLVYYPLTKKGERFPIADATKEPCLDPVPNERSQFLHGILQSIGDVERDGFRALQDLGSTPPNMIWTCGGGSRNDVWSQIRERRISAAFPESSIKVCKAECTEASYGAALLAAATFK